MQSKHSAEVSKLQKHIDDLDNQVIRMQMTVVKATAAGQQTSNRWEERESWGSIFSGTDIFQTLPCFLATVSQL